MGEGTSSVVADSEPFLDTSPAANSFASLAPSPPPTHHTSLLTTADPAVIHAKPPTRTYGKRVASAASNLAGDRDAAVTSDASSKVAARRSSLHIPETDEALEQPPSSQNTRDDFDFGNLNSDDVTMRAGDADDDASESSSDEAAAKPNVAIFTRKTVAELMAEQEEKERLEDEAEAQATISISRPLPSSSTLPPLTDSEPASASDFDAPPRTDSSSTSPPSAKPHPPSDDSLDIDIDDEAPVAKRKIGKPRRAILDSDDEDAENGSDDDLPTAASLHRKSLSARTIASPPSSPPAQEPERPMTKREKLEAMANKKKLQAQKLQRQIGEDVAMDKDAASEVEDIEANSDDGALGIKKQKGKKPAKKNKGLSKKAEDEMHKETAALQRNTAIHLQSRTKTAKSIFDIVRSSRKDLPLPPTSSRPMGTISDFNPAAHLPTPPLSRPITTTRELPSSSIKTSSPSVHTLTTSPANAKPSSSRLKLPPPAAKSLSTTYDDDEEDLPDLAVVQQRLADKKQAEKDAAERKILLANERREAVARATALRKKAAELLASNDSDASDDLEIEGDPNSKAKAGQRSRTTHPPTPKATLAEASRAPRMSSSKRKIGRLMGSKAHLHDHDDDVTDSQFVTAGQTYGANLGPDHRELLKSSTSSKPKASKTGNAHFHSGVVSSKAPPSNKNRVPVITKEGLEHSLQAKAREQALTRRVKKQLQFRSKQETDRVQRRKEELAAVDVEGITAMKKAKMDKGEEIEDEDAQDGDWIGSDEDAKGSGQESAYETGDEEDEEGLAAGSGEEDDEVSDTEKSMGAEAEEDDEESMPPPKAISTRRVKVVVDDEDESPERRTGAKSSSRSPSARSEEDEAVPQRMALFGAAGGDDAGFTQLFGFGDDDEGGVSQFGRDDDVDAQLAAPLPSFGARIVADEDLEADACELEAYGADQTPRPQPGYQPLRFLNKDGLLTQTRPTNFAFGSPIASVSSVVRTESFVTTDPRSQSQISQTQVHPETPSQPPREGRRLVRQEALVPYGSLDLPATEVELDATKRTSVATSEGFEETQPDDDEEDDSQMINISSAQPPSTRNAFEILTAAIREPPAAPPAIKRKAPNAFVNDQADLSDEEDFGTRSDDEDEEGLDAELAELVDREVVDQELESEQDSLARQLHDAEMAREDAEKLAHVTRVTEGKERLKRKNGGVDFSDDEFDDDGYGMTKNKDKRVKRAKNATMEELEANEDTQAFAQPLKAGLAVQLKPGEVDFLNAPADDEARSDEDEDMDAENEGDLNDDDEASGSERQSRIPTYVEVERAMVQKSKQRREETFSPEPLSPRLYNGTSSSPDTFNTVAIAAFQRKVKLIGTGEVESQGSFIARYRTETAWKADSKEESQGNGKTLGRDSAVTSFKKGKNLKSAMGGAISGGANGKTTITRRDSTIQKFRKNGFAT